eukprot:TRINITY_DN2041_c0_g1_i10.p1 TRINITY_DN2041_c0_g1~~TRINITY_DN2041_c0_g1_i10.p1  ORF type:complete len:474 (-),score=109.48 TRINITY_DN2041_c0_g1_i10:616-2037(-)
MSHTFYVSSEEAAEFFSNDRQKQDNKICCDCSAPNPPWASVSNGIYLCLECATQHRSFGVQASLVRSLTLDKWTLQQLKYMECGGNAELRRYYADNGLALTGPQVDRYTSKQAVAYREMLKVKAIAAATTESPPLVLPDIVHSEKPFNRPNASHSSPNIFHSERLSSSPSSSNKPEGTEESSKFALGEKIQSMQKGLEKVTETTKKAASTAAIKIQEAHLTDRLRSSSAKGWSSLQSGWTAAVSSLQKDKKSPAILITEEKLAAVSSEGSPNLAESEANDGIDPLSDSARPTLGVKLSDVSSQLHQASGKGWAVMKEYWEVAQAKVKTRTDTSATGSTIIDPPLSDGGSPDVARSDHGVADTNSSSLQDNHPNRAQEEAAPMSDDDDVGDKLHSPSCKIILALSFLSTLSLLFLSFVFVYHPLFSSTDVWVELVVVSMKFLFSACSSLFCGNEIESKACLLYFAEMVSMDRYR